MHRRNSRSNYSSKDLVRKGSRSEKRRPSLKDGRHFFVSAEHRFLGLQKRDSFLGGAGFGQVDTYGEEDTYEEEDVYEVRGFLKNKLKATQESPYVPVVPRDTKERKWRDRLTLDGNFRTSPELAKIKYLLGEMPLFAKTEKLQKHEGAVIREILESLLWNIYSIHKKGQPLKDNFLTEATLEWCKVAEKQKSIPRSDFGTPTRLSIAVACDCLRRLGEKSELHKVLFEEISNAVYIDTSNKSLYKATPWRIAARNGDGLDMKQSDLLKKVFLAVPKAQSAELLVQVLVDQDEDKNKQKSEWALDFHGDIVQMALRGLQSPPCEFLENLISSFDIDVLNKGLKNFSILPRLSRLLARKSLENIHLRKRALNRRGNREDANSTNTTIDPVVAKVLARARDDDELRGKVLRELLVTEEEEFALADLFFVLLDQMAHIGCSDEVYNQIANNDTIAMKVLTSKILGVCKEKGMTMDMHGSPSSLASMKRRKIPEKAMIPPEWELFLGAAKSQIKVKGVKREDDKIPCLLLAMYRQRLKDEVERVGATTDAFGEAISIDREFSFKNKSPLAEYVLRHVILKSASRVASTKRIVEIVEHINGNKNDRWYQMFGMFSGLLPTKLVSLEPVFCCFLFALRVVEKRIWLDEDMLYRMPGLEFTYCVEVLAKLHKFFNFVDVEQGRVSLDNIRFTDTTTPPTHVPLAGFLGFIFDCACGHAQVFEDAISTVYEEFLDSLQNECSPMLFKTMVSRGLKSVGLHAHDDRHIENLHCQLMMETPSITRGNFIRAVILFARTRQEIRTYENSLASDDIF